jgi:hypothetical protein|tara:strand:+ start:206 stop:799 length:594 start_codon:yes stop_codon:yes gene_type:complete
MGKNKFRFKTLTVRDALKKGLQPYKDFYPLKGPPKNKKNSKPDNRTLAEMMQEDSPLKSWADLGNVAKDLYDTPGEALDVLARESIKVPKTNPKTLMMCELLERVRKDKKNKDKKFNKIIDEHLEQCCTFMDVDYSLVDIPKSEMIKGSTYNKKKKYSRQDIIDRIVTRHGNLVIKQPGKFKDWLNTHSHTVRKLLK